MTAQQSVPGQFVDPYQYNLNDYYQYGPAPTSDVGIAGWFRRNFGGVDTEAARQRRDTAANQAYERASIDSARAWSEYMDNTATQRRVKDIEAAGLNPWLAVQSGISGTGAPSVDTGGTARAHTNSGQSSGILRGLLMLIAGMATKNSNLAAAGGASMATAKQMPYVMTKGHK